MIALVLGNASQYWYLLKNHDAGRKNILESSSYWSFLSESFSPQFFDMFFAQFFNLPYFPVFVFSKYWIVNELDIFGSGSFHE